MFYPPTHVAGGFIGFEENQTRSFFSSSERQRVVSSVLHAVRSETDRRSILPELAMMELLVPYPVLSLDLVG